MSTKAELQKEVELLREMNEGRTQIQNCTFNGSPSGEVCSAVLEIATALKYAAKALQGAPAIQIGAVASQDESTGEE